MRELMSSSRKRRSKYLATVLGFVMILLLLVSSQPACTLILDTAYYRTYYATYNCRSTLVDSVSGERRVVNSSMLSTDAPGATARTISGYDWDHSGTAAMSDALLYWRRYLRNDIVTSSRFMGRTWCIRPSETTCTLVGRTYYTSTPADLPAAELTDCFETTGAQLEVTAPGLTTDNQFDFPDAAVGATGSTPVLFTVTNRSSVALRVNAVDFTAGGDVPDFAKSADNCAPTTAERTAGRGHLLGAAAACTFQMQFLPRHRDGVAECLPGSPNDSCRRRATLNVTGEVDSSRNVVTPVNVRVLGRAIGGSITLEPGNEICFPTAPAVGACTPYQTLRIRNTTAGDLTLTSARLTRAGNRWEATMPFLMPLTLSMGLSIDVPVRFCNVANDPTDGEFTINSSSPTNPTTVVTLVNPLNRRCP